MLWLQAISRKTLSRVPRTADLRDPFLDRMDPGLNFRLDGSPCITGGAKGLTLSSVRTRPALAF